MIGAAFRRALFGYGLLLIREPLALTGGRLILLLAGRAALLVAAASAAYGLSHGMNLQEKGRRRSGGLF